MEAGGFLKNSLGLPSSFWWAKIARITSVFKEMTRITSVFKEITRIKSVFKEMIDCIVPCNRWSLGMDN